MLDLPSKCSKAFFSLTILVVLMYSCFAQVANKSVEHKNIVASFYCHGSKQCKIVGKGITATGLKVRNGIIAVDPMVIPLRRHVEIVEPKSLAGMYFSADTGRDIKKNRIDVWVSSQKEAMKLGKIKNVVLRVYPKGYTLPVKKEEGNVPEVK